MHKVFLHTHERGKTNWVNEIIEFGRIPLEGEHLAISPDSEWYQVELVVHTPFSEDMEAEVYAVKVDHEKVKKSRLKTTSEGVYFPKAP